MSEHQPSRLRRLRALARLFAGPRLSRLPADQRGVAAVEFAVIVPVLVTMYLGLVQVTQGVIVDRKVTLLARTLSDLTAQATKVPDTELNNIFEAARYVLQPIDPSPAKMMIASVYVDKDQKVKLCWAEVRNGMPKPNAIALPAGLMIPNSSVIVATAEYPYSAPVKLFKEVYNLSDTIYMRPRLVPQVPRETGGTTQVCSTT